MSTRNLLGDDHLMLKAAYRTLLKAAGGPVYAAEHITRTDAARLSRYGNPNEQMFAPMDVIRDLEAHVGEPIVSRVLADLAGFVLVPKKAATRSVDFDQHLATVAREMSDVVGEIVAAKADGTVTPNEIKSIRTQVRESQEALADLDADLERAENSVVSIDRKRA
jgi:hypothetical protein